MNFRNEEARGAHETVPSRRIIDFGLGGNCDKVVTTGWSSAESGFRWMVGFVSEIRLDQALDDGDYVIEFEMGPFVRPPIIPSQRFTVSVNGALIGQSVVTQGGRLGYRLTISGSSEAAPTSIVMGHPDAARPCDCGPSDDSRLLSIWVKRLAISTAFPGKSGLRLEGVGGRTLSEIERAVGLAPDKFMLCFESLGDNCEFGLVQRRCDAEPLSLLRFSSTALPSLLRGLDIGFQDLGSSADIEFRLDGKARREYIVHEKNYGLVYHTFRYEGETDRESLVSKEPARLAFLVRKLVEDLKSGEKIFVCKRNLPLREDEILPLYAAINSYGRNFLLWVVPADTEGRSGTVEIVMPGLLKGFIARFAPGEDAPDLALDAWLDVCVNAYLLSRT